MDDLEDLTELLDAPTLKLPISGKTYVVEAADADRWLHLQQIAAKLDNGDTADEPAVEIYELSLGAVFQEMVDDGVPGAFIPKAGFTAFFWQTNRPEAAAAYWRAGGKAVAAKKPPTSPTPRTTRTGAATSTRRRASGSGTSGQNKRRTV